MLPLARVSLCAGAPAWLQHLECDARFNTHLFLFLFLPAVLLGYWLGKPRWWKLAWVTFASLVFYCLWDVRFVVLILAAAAVDFAVALGIERAPTPRRRKAWLLGSIVFNLGVLAVFKYSVFAAANARSLLHLLGSPVTLPYFSIVLPVGISFFTFKTLSYTIDVYRGEVAACREPLKYLAFISLFPELVAGPIVRYSTVGEQLDALPSRVPWDHMALGMTLFAVGLFKKAAVADVISSFTDGYWAKPHALTTLQGWLAALGYTLQLYFDFSGYSDMAMGLGAMLGLRFPINFLAPYQALNPSDFWRRWHISLSTWLRDYLYIPLGGNRKGAGRAKVNLLLVMLLGGLWHGANWTFVVWGGYHGLLLVLYQSMRAGWDRLHRAAAQGLTFLLALAGWVIFRAPDLASASAVYRAMLLPHGGASHLELFLLFALLGVAAFTWLAPPITQVKMRWTAVRAAVIGALLAASLFFMNLGSSPFLYYQF